MAALVHSPDQLGFALALSIRGALARGAREEAERSLADATALAGKRDTLSARTLAALALGRDELAGNKEPSRCRI